MTLAKTCHWQKDFIGVSWEQANLSKFSGRKFCDCWRVEAFDLSRSLITHRGRPTQWRESSNSDKLPLLLTIAPLNGRRLRRPLFPMLQLTNIYWISAKVLAVSKILIQFNILRMSGIFFQLLWNYFKEVQSKTGWRYLGLPKFLMSFSAINIFDQLGKPDAE